MPVSGSIISDALSEVGAVGGQIKSFDELAAGADAALRAAPPGLTALGAASYLADKAQESDYFRATEEYAKNGRYAPCIGRTFQMVTWDNNYLLFGRWCKAKGHIQNSERQFVDDPPWLADYRWAWLGGVWYFEHTGLWKWANAGDHYSVSQGVNRGMGAIGTSKDPNHWDVRRRMFDVFRQYGDQLLPADRIPAPPSAQPQPPSSSPSVDTIRFVEGDTGPRVAHFQRWFNDNFPVYAGTPLDLAPQRYGPATRGVIKEFADRCQIAGADGKNIGPKIAQAMWDLGYRPAP